MDPRTQLADRELAAFRTGRSVEGRFLSYCRGRSRHFWMRQILVAVCFPVFMLMADWRTGVFAALVVLSGEALDCSLLHWLGKRRSLGPRLPVAICATTLTGGLQALTICYFVALVYTLGGPDARSFAVAVCIAAVLDAALLYGVHRGAAVVRLAVYGLALVLMALNFWFSGEGRTLRLFYDAASVTLLLYVVWAMVRHINRSRRRNAAI